MTKIGLILFDVTSQTELNPKLVSLVFSVTLPMWIFWVTLQLMEMSLPVTNMKQWDIFPSLVHSCTILITFKIKAFMPPPMLDGTYHLVDQLMLVAFHNNKNCFCVLVTPEGVSHKSFWALIFNLKLVLLLFSSIPTYAVENSALVLSCQPMLLGAKVTIM